MGRSIGSAALVADGRHARSDGLISLAVLLGVGGVAIGWAWADAAVGLLITIALLGCCDQPCGKSARASWTRWSRNS